MMEVSDEVLIFSNPNLYSSPNLRHVYASSLLTDPQNGWNQQMLIFLA